MKTAHLTVRNWALACLVGLFLVMVTGWGVRSLWRYYTEQKLLGSSYEPPPQGMVFVAPGEFFMGSDLPDADPDERPLRKVFLPGFYIDRLEVTNREYREWKKDHVYPEGADDLPVSKVLRHEAEAFARAQGKRLPTGAEWEKAARGTNGWSFPWGNNFNPEWCNVRGGGGFYPPTTESASTGYQRGKLAVDSFPEGASPYDCLNMSGNVWEWVADDWVDRDLWGRKTGMRRGVIRGGAFGYSSRQARTSYQGFEALETTCKDVGFRCVKEAVMVR